MLTLDHVAFGARDPAAAARAFTVLGFEPSAPSRCEWTIAGTFGSAAAVCIVFRSEYLDIVEVASARWREHLESSAVYGRGFAPTGIVLSGRDPARAHAELVAADPGAFAPYPITRRLGEPGAEIAYELLPLRGGGLPLALISDSSPDALRRPAWLAHPNGAIGIAAVHLRVPSLAGALAHLAEPPLFLEPRRLLEPRRSDGEAELSLGAASIWIHERPRDRYLASVSALLPKLELPALLALELRVLSLEAAAATLREQRVRFDETPESLCVDPDQGFGTGIVFRGTREKR